VDAAAAAGIVTADHGEAGPGLREAIAVWALWAVVAATVWVTYSRLPASDFYNVTGTGVRSGAARVLVLVGWPISLAVLALLAVAADRLLALPLRAAGRRAVVAVAAVSALLCATIAWPGVIRQSNLDAKPANALAAIGASLAAALTVAALRRAGPGPPAPRRRGDRIALVIAVVYALAAIPWILANLGIYAGDVPGASAVFMSKKILPEAGHPHLHAVHLGNHEGLDGWLLAVTALLLRPVLARMRPTRLRPVLGGYLAVLLAYGVLVTANDGWNEQVVKRGWTSFGLPDVITPAASAGWAILLVAATVLYVTAFRVTPRQPPAGERAT
jgi:hypothetical protein